jgi:hypothetical protein
MIITSHPELVSEHCHLVPGTRDQGRVILNLFQDLLTFYLI